MLKPTVILTKPLFQDKTYYFDHDFLHSVSIVYLCLSESELCPIKFIYPFEVIKIIQLELTTLSPASEDCSAASGAKTIL